MFRKLSLLMTVLAALGLAVALASCGKKGALERPSDKQNEETRLDAPTRTV